MGNTEQDAKRSVDVRMDTVIQQMENASVISDSLDLLVNRLVHPENMVSIALWTVNVTVRHDVIQCKDVVIVLQEDTVVGVNSHVLPDSMDGIARSLAPVRMVLIVMELMDGVCVQQVSKETNVNRNVEKGHLVRHVVNRAIVESINVIRRMGSVYVQWEDMVHCVKRSVGLEDMESPVITSVNASMEQVVIQRLVNAVALQDGLVQHVK